MTQGVTSPTNHPIINARLFYEPPELRPYNRKANFMQSRRIGLWLHADFRKLWIGQTISEFGSGITGQALPFAAILVLEASSAELGLLAAAGAIPALLFGLPAGVWVDRLQRRPIMIAADLLRALTLLSVPLAALTGALSIWQLLIVAASMGLLNLFFEVAYRSYLPSVIGRDQLVEGNSKLGVSSSVAEIGGPSVAGILVQWLTAPFAILVDALSFLVSALCIGLIRAREPLSPPSTEHQTFRGDVAEGLRFVLRDPILGPLARCTGTFTFFGGFFVLYQLYAVRELGIPPAIVGVIIGLGGIGALLGALLASRVTRYFGLGKTLVGSLAFYVGIQIAVPFAGGPYYISAIILGVTQIVGDVAVAIYLINEVSLRQSATPDRLLGRANASTGFLIGTLGLLGALLGGLLGELLGPRLTLFISIAGGTLSSLWLLFSPVFSLREQPMK